MPIIEVNHIIKEYRLGQLQSLKHSLQLTMLRYGVNDLRLFFENDLKLFKQFA